MDCEQFRELMKSLNRIAEAQERIADAVEATLTNVSGGKSFGLVIEDIRQPAIESIALATRE